MSPEPASLAPAPHRFLVRGDAPPADGGDAIAHVTIPCSLGWALVAAGRAGVCAILLGDDPAILARDLSNRFPGADLRNDEDALGDLPRRAVRHVESPWGDPGFALDLRGTPFRVRVWEALRGIRPGVTVTYAELARMVHEPKAVRAVAGACGANPVAVVVPCHRVVRSDGDQAGYRWGDDRKRELLLRERMAG